MPEAVPENVTGTVVVVLWPYWIFKVVGAELTVKAPAVPAPVLTTKSNGDEVPPPRFVGLTTVMGIMPTAVKSPAGTEAVNCDALTQVVGRVEPFQSTVAPFPKLLPLVVRVKAGVPAVAVGDGDKLVIVGAGVVTEPAITVTVRDPLEVT